MNIRKFRAYFLRTIWYI